MSEEVGQVNKGVLQDAGGDQDDRKQDTHSYQTFRSGYDDVFVYDDINQVGLQRVEWCQDDGQQCAE